MKLKRCFNLSSQFLQRSILSDHYRPGLGQSTNYYPQVSKIRLFYPGPSLCHGPGPCLLPGHSPGRFPRTK